MYEVHSDGSTIQYYPAGGAMKVTSGSTSTLSFILSDHLGSTSVVTDASGGNPVYTGYYPFGETRYITGKLFTDHLYTGQQQNSYINLLNFRSRWYDAQLGRFISPDSIIPNSSPQSLNRYSYSNNNPINYNDPTGHTACSDIPNSEARKYCEDKGGVPGFGLDNQTSNQETTLLRIGSQSCDAKCIEGAQGASMVAGILDGVAWGINALYAIGTDIGTLIQPELYPEFLVAYQPMSIAANAISSFAGGVWIAKDFMTGDNYLDVKWNESKQIITVSGSISQDSIATIVTNAVGWNLREPNQAFLLDSGVLGYDLGRSFPLPGGSAPPIPTFMHPTFSFSFRIP